MSDDLKEIYKFGFWIPLAFVIVILIKLIFFPQNINKTQTKTRPSINEATSTATEPNVYNTEGNNITPTTIEEKNQKLFHNRCTNDLFSFTILYPDEVTPISGSEAERCMNFVFLADGKEQEKAAITIRTVENNIDDLAENIVASLGDIKIENFDIENGYNSKIIKGTWPAESINSGINYSAILVENQDQYVLVFEVKYDLSENENNLLRNMVSTIEFL